MTEVAEQQTKGGMSFDLIIEQAKSPVVPKAVSRYAILTSMSH